MTKRMHASTEPSVDFESYPQASLVNRIWDQITAFADAVAHPRRKRRAIDGLAESTERTTSKPLNQISTSAESDTRDTFCNDKNGSHDPFSNVESRPMYSTDGNETRSEQNCTTAQPGPESLEREQGDLEPVSLASSCDGDAHSISEHSHQASTMKTSVRLSSGVPNTNMYSAGKGADTNEETDKEDMACEEKGAKCGTRPENDVVSEEITEEHQKVEEERQQDRLLDGEPKLPNDPEKKPLYDQAQSNETAVHAFKEKERKTIKRKEDEAAVRYEVEKTESNSDERASFYRDEKVKKSATAEGEVEGEEAEEDEVGEDEAEKEEAEEEEAEEEEAEEEEAEEDEAEEDEAEEEEEEEEEAEEDEEGIMEEEEDDDEEKIEAKSKDENEDEEEEEKDEELNNIADEVDVIEEDELDVASQPGSSIKHSQPTTEIVVIDDSDEDANPSAPRPSASTEPPARDFASLSVQPQRKSQFSPNYSSTITSPIPKQLFRGSRANKRMKVHAQGLRQSGRPSSSISSRRKAPLGNEEFKAGIQSRQQARIVSMIYDTYRAVTQGNKSPAAFEDFQGLVRKRMHVQQLLDMETLRIYPEHARKDLDEQTYTQRTLDAIRERAARARTRFPPRALPEEEQLKQIRTERAKRRAEHGILGRKQLPEALPEPLEQGVRKKWQQRGVIASMTGAQVEAHDLAKLRPGQWLNDEVINFYGNLILQRANQGEAERRSALENHKTPSLQSNGVWTVHFFSSFFWQKLQNQGYSGVQRWSRRVDLFTKDLILIPINLGQSHWVCAVVNLRLRRFEYYDSMGIERPSVFTILRDYLSQELRTKKQLTLDLSDWEDYFGGDSSPQQANGYDCGVFAIQTLEQLSRRDPLIPMPPPLSPNQFCKPADPATLRRERQLHADDYAWNFDQRHMPYLRRRMVHEIASKQLLE